MAAALRGRDFELAVGSSRVSRARVGARFRAGADPTLIVANHQHDFESLTIVSTTTVHSGSWRHPIFTASSRRMYEPGFLARSSAVAALSLRRVNAGQDLDGARNAARSKTSWARARSPRSRGPCSAVTVRCRSREIFDERVAVAVSAGDEDHAICGTREYFLLARQTS